ncbi:hypothetical protein Tco_0667495, partial [Tanacetum coccineum]
MLAQVSNRGNVGNQNGNVDNENVRKNGGAVVLTRWIEKMESVHDMSGCSVDQKFCPSHEMQKLESELWNHAMVGVGHAAYTNRFHELASNGAKDMQKAVQISSALTDEAVRNRSIMKVKKRGNVEEPIKDKNGRDDNKRTRTGNAFVTTVTPIGRENTGHLAKDCRGVLRNVNPVNARNPTVRACYKCGSTDYVRSSCPRFNRAQGLEENHPNQVAANNGGQGCGNQGNQARG